MQLIALVLNEALGDGQVAGLGERCHSIVARGLRRAVDVPQHHTFLHGAGEEVLLERTSAGEFNGTVVANFLHQPRQDLAEGRMHPEQGLLAGGELRHHGEQFQGAGNGLGVETRTPALQELHVRGVVTHAGDNADEGFPINIDGEIRTQAVKPDPLGVEKQGVCGHVTGIANGDGFGAERASADPCGTVVADIK